MWALYCDLEENFGTVKTTQAAYDMALELKVRNICAVLARLGHITFECWVTFD